MNDRLQNGTAAHTSAMKHLLFWALYCVAGFGVVCWVVCTVLFGPQNPFRSARRFFYDMYIGDYDHPEERKEHFELWRSEEDGGLYLTVYRSGKGIDPTGGKSYRLDHTIRGNTLPEGYRVDLAYYKNFDKDNPGRVWYLLTNEQPWEEDAHLTIPNVAFLPHRDYEYPILYYWKESLTGEWPQLNGSPGLEICYRGRWYTVGGYGTDRYDDTFEIGWFLFPAGACVMNSVAQYYDTNLPPGLYRLSGVPHSFFLITKDQAERARELYVEAQS